MKKRLVVLGGIVLGAAAGCGDVLGAFVLRPSTNFRLTPADFGYAYREIALDGGEGRQVSVWHVATTSAVRKGILVMVPGNDANKGRYTVGLPIFVDDGWDVILMDYEGFGASTGKASFDGLIRSTRTVLDYAFTQDPTVVGFGISLGTSVLARVAADYDLKAAVFESLVNVWEITSEFTDRHGLGSPAWGLADAVAALSTSGDFNTKHWIAQVTEPKLFLHSPDDNVTPFAGAREVFDLAPQPKHFLSTQGEHALQMFLDPVLYRAVINGWLDGVLNNDPIQNQRFQELLDAEIRATLGELGLAPRT